MDKKCTQLWQRLSAALKPQVSADTFKRWFSAVELVEASDKSLTFRVPNNIYQFWIESNHMPALQTAIVTALGSPRGVKFSSPSGATTQMPLEDGASLKISPESPATLKRPQACWSTQTRLNRSCRPINEIAHAASRRAVAGPDFNPLFIYGGVGLKTHLMQAIGQYAWAKKKNAMYLPANCSSTSSSTSSTVIQFRCVIARPTSFNRRYSPLGGKERSQEEFFSTFNTLTDISRSCLQRPACIEIATEHRLVRLNGTYRELQPPDIETRMPSCGKSTRW
jgi:chromosomal replication initiator protein